MKLHLRLIFRASFKLSTAIECTWQILNAQLSDKEAEKDGTLLEQDQSIRMAYAMALIRFVNLNTEKGQTRQYAQPVHVLAEELGLPEWLVNLRHDATHAGLPSLTLMRDAASFAMKWLKSTYWEAQREEEFVEPSKKSTKSPPKEVYSEAKITMLVRKVYAMKCKILSHASELKKELYE